VRTWIHRQEWRESVGFELRDHTADVAVAATGETLGDVFAAVADGLTAAMCEDVPDGGERFDLTVEGGEPRGTSVRLPRRTDLRPRRRERPPH